MRWTPVADRRRGHARSIETTEQPGRAGGASTLRLHGGSQVAVVGDHQQPGGGRRARLRIARGRRDRSGGRPPTDARRGARSDRLRSACRATRARARRRTPARCRPAQGSRPEAGRSAPPAVPGRRGGRVPATGSSRRPAVDRCRSGDRAAGSPGHRTRGGTRGSDRPVPAPGPDVTTRHTFRTNVHDRWPDVTTRHTFRRTCTTPVRST